MIEGLDLSPANNVLGVVGAGADEQGAEGGAAAAHGSGAKWGKEREDDEEDDVWGDDDDDDEGGGGGGGSGGGGGRQPLPILPYAMWQVGVGHSSVGRVCVSVYAWGGGWN